MQFVVMMQGGWEDELEGQREEMCLQLNKFIYIMHHQET